MIVQKHCTSYSWWWDVTSIKLESATCLGLMLKEEGEGEGGGGGGVGELSTDKHI